MTNKNEDKQLEKKMKKLLVKIEKTSETYNKLMLSFKGLIKSTPYEGYYNSIMEKNNINKEMFI